MKIAAIIITTLICFSHLLASAQTEEREANFHFKTENYTECIKIYQKLLEKDSTNMDYNYQIGFSYLRCNNNRPQALKHLKVVEKDHQSDPEFVFDLGKAYLYNYDFKNARACFENCKSLSQKNDALKNDADTWYQMTENAERMVKSPLDVSFINLGKYINTKMDEITPYMTPDNEMLLYTSNKKYDPKFFLNIYNVYYSYHDDGVFKKGRPLGTVNSIDDEFMAGISLNNNNIYVQLQGFDAFQDLIQSERTSKSFSGKLDLNDNVNSKAAEFGACETASGDTLFFSSNRDGSLGGMDIFYSQKLPTGEWGEARNAGPAINTPFDEDLPVVSVDGSTLYFTSNRPQSMGGYDIFESQINPQSRELSSPKNIGYPLNDVFDNKTIAYSDNDRYAYLSAFKPDGFGYNDLYQVVFNQKDPAVKIFLLSFTNKKGENQVPFADADVTLKIKVQKGKSIFGEYAYNVPNSSSTIALPPGDYTLEVSGAKTQKYTRKLNIPDTPTGEKIEKLGILLDFKNNN